MNEFNRIVRINDVALFQEGEGEEGESVGSDVEGEFHQFKFLINCHFLWVRFVFLPRLCKRKGKSLL